MITDKDIQKILLAFIPIFATKEDLKQFATKVELSELRNDVFTKMDQVYGEVKVMREEQSAHNLLHKKIDQDLAQIKSLPTISRELQQHR